MTKKQTGQDPSRKGLPDQPKSRTRTSILRCPRTARNLVLSDLRRDPKLTRTQGQESGSQPTFNSETYLTQT